MPSIIIRTMDANDQVANTAISGHFKERSEAAAQLDKMVQELKKQEKNAGFDKEQGYWWTRENGIVTRYMIED